MVIDSHNEAVNVYSSKMPCFVCVMFVFVPFAFVLYFALLFKDSD